MRFSSINLAFFPVKYVMVTPPRVTGSIWTLGFKYPSFDGVQITSTTLASAFWSDSTILNANACSGFLSMRLYTLSSEQITPSISYRYSVRHFTNNSDNFSFVSSSGEIVIFCTTFTFASDDK